MTDNRIVIVPKLLTKYLEEGYTISETVPAAGDPILHYIMNPPEVLNVDIRSDHNTKRYI